MHAMQYEIGLPSDDDTGIVRDRVARAGHLLDDWEGLGVKAYLMRERGRDGSPVNQYAPFYLWNTVAGMNAFLWGGGLQRIRDDFGRPSVRQWTGLAYGAGGAVDSVARVAVRRRAALPDRARLADAVADAVRETTRLAELDGAVLAATTVDTSRWELVHFSRWAHDGPNARGEREGAVFRVLHLSAPGRDRLPRGRQW